MYAAGDAQQRVVHLAEAVLTDAHGFWHDLLNFLSHHAELPASTAMLELGLVVEQVKTETQRMPTYARDPLFVVTSLGFMLPAPSPDFEPVD